MKANVKSGAAMLAQGSTRNWNLDMFKLSQKGLFWQVLQTAIFYYLGGSYDE